MKEDKHSWLKIGDTINCGAVFDLTTHNVKKYESIFLWNYKRSYVNLCSTRMVLTEKVNKQFKK